MMFLVHGINENEDPRYRCTRKLERSSLNAVRCTYQDPFLWPSSFLHLRNNGGLRLMQDSVPNHSARTTMTFLQANEVNILPWPYRSPDLIPSNILGRDW